jgi:dihydrofolate synthase / folylpolyglutamate synthase
VTEAAARQPAHWSEREAEDYLLNLEQFGMRFGLERIRQLLEVLGAPQRRYAKIHVVGTNGKSSTVRMTAAILHRHGLRAAAYLSPHLVSFAERLRIDDADLEPATFAQAVQRAAAAAAQVDGGREADDHVTQFEALTAAAYQAFADAGTDVAVIEAGLGGRWDATNVIDAPIVVLTGVGLEHTRLLGDTVREIAGEKLAVVPAGATLIVGADLHPDAMEVARGLDARIVVVPADDSGVALRARAPFQRRNFALARTAAQVHLGRTDPEKVAAAAAATRVPGRFEQIADAPPTFLDGAHNPDGMRALAEAVRGELGGAALTVVLSILQDKDPAQMLAHLSPLARRVVATSSDSPRAIPAPAVEGFVRDAGIEDVRTVPDPRDAVAAAQGLAREDGGVVLVTGSISLIADLLRTDRSRRGSML